MQIRDYIYQLAEEMDQAGLIFAHGTATALDEAVYLVYCELGIGFDESVQALTTELSVQQRSALDALRKKRVEDKVPAAYLLGRAWFAGHEFICDPRALVPRSPIAELIANRFQPMLATNPGQILDLCCGGGCIGIAAALEFPRSQVCLADISRDCLDLAAENIRLHGLGDRVSTRQSDLFASLSQRYDLIVSNPPYVSAEEVAELAPEFGHEPRQGLVSEDQGLAIPLSILRQAADYLEEPGLLIMEVGYSAAALQQRLSGVPLLWLEFEEGGEGVFALTRRQLEQFRDEFN
jgi:ribosomal protein L3 glutamine methyltransferase